MLAEKTRVSLDWLLFGEGGDSPVLRGAERSEQALADDYRGFVEQAIRARVRSDALPLPPDVLADRADVLPDKSEAEFRELVASALLRSSRGRQIASLEAAVDTAVRLFGEAWLESARLLASVARLSGGRSSAVKVRKLVAALPVRSQLTTAALELANDYESVARQLIELRAGILHGVLVDEPTAPTRKRKASR